MICRRLNSFRHVDEALSRCRFIWLFEVEIQIPGNDNFFFPISHSSPRRKLLRYPHWVSDKGTENKTFSFWRWYIHPKALKIRLIILKLLNNLVIEVRGDVNKNTTFTAGFIWLRTSE